MAGARADQGYFKGVVNDKAGQGAGFGEGGKVVVIAVFGAQGVDAPPEEGDEHGHGRNAAEQYNEYEFLFCRFKGEHFIDSLSITNQGFSMLEIYYATPEKRKSNYRKIYSLVLFSFACSITI